jgi:hypothetical protein
MAHIFTGNINMFVPYNFLHCRQGFVYSETGFELDASRNAS